MMNKNCIRFNYKHYVFLIITFSVVIRCFSLKNRFFWCDEVSSVLTSRYSLEELLYHASFDVHPPFYYLLLHGWMMLFGDGMFATRALSVLFGVISVALTFKLVRLIANERMALLAGWFAAIMPMSVRYSQEARMYALLGCLVIASTIVLVLWLKQPGRHRYLVAYTLLMTLGFYTHYFMIFILLTHWLVLLILSLSLSESVSYLKMPGWWLANLAIGIAYIPWFMVLFNLLEHIKELRVGGDVGWIAAVKWDDLPAMYWRFFIGDYPDYYPDWLFYFLPGFFFIFSCLQLFVTFKEKKFNLIIVAQVFIPVVIVFFVSFKFPLFIDRYLLFSCLFIPMLVAIVIDIRKRARVALFLFFNVLFIIGLHSEYAKKEQGWETIVSYINMHHQQQDSVMINNMFNYLSYIYYNPKDHRALLYTPPKKNGVSGKPNAYGFGTFFHDRADQIYVENLIRLAPVNGRIWLIDNHNLTSSFGALPANWVKIDNVKTREFEAQLFKVER